MAQKLQIGRARTHTYALTCSLAQRQFLEPIESRRASLSRQKPYARSAKRVLFKIQRTRNSVSAFDKSPSTGRVLHTDTPNIYILWELDCTHLVAFHTFVSVDLLYSRAYRKLETRQRQPALLNLTASAAAARLNPCDSTHSEQCSSPPHAVRRSAAQSHPCQR